MAAPSNKILQIPLAQISDPELRDALQQADGTPGVAGLHTAPDDVVTIYEYETARNFFPEHFQKHRREIDRLYSAIAEGESVKSAVGTIVQSRLATVSRNLMRRHDVPNQMDLQPLLDELLRRMENLAAGGQPNPELFIQAVGRRLDFALSLTQDNFDLDKLNSSDAGRRALETAFKIKETADKLSSFAMSNGTYDARVAGSIRDVTRMVDVLFREVQRATLQADELFPPSAMGKMSPGTRVFTAEDFRKFDFRNMPGKVMALVMHGGSVASEVIRPMSAKEPGSGPGVDPLSRNDAPTSHFSVVLRDDEGKFGKKGELYVLEWLVSNGGRLKKFHPEEYIKDNLMVMGQVFDHPDPWVRDVWQKAFEAGTFALATKIKSIEDSSWVTFKEALAPWLTADIHRYGFEFLSDLSDPSTYCALALNRIITQQAAQEVIEAAVAALPAEKRATGRNKLEHFYKVPFVQSAFESGLGNDRVLAEFGKPSNVQRSVFPGDALGAPFRTAFMSYNPQKIEKAMISDAAFSAVMNYLFGDGGYTLNIPWYRRVAAYIAIILRNMPFIGEAFMRDLIEPQAPAGAIGALMTYEKLSKYLSSYVADQQELFNQARKERGLKPRPFSFREIEGVVIQHVENQQQIKDALEKLDPESSKYQLLKTKLSDELFEIIKEVSAPEKLTDVAQRS